MMMTGFLVILGSTARVSLKTKQNKTRFSQAEGIMSNGSSEDGPTMQRQSFLELVFLPTFRPGRCGEVVHL